MFDSLLIANRGEIACRVIRTARRLGIRTVAVYSDADADALHVALADEGYRLGPAPARESYLRADRIVAIAKRARAGAIHPGYGFLAENAEFAQACASAGIVFVGPPPEAIRVMGDKDTALRTAAAAGVPILPGYHEDDQAPETLRAAAEEVGYPLMIKPVAGGGGKGMRVVRAAADLDEALASARREAESSFGRGDVLLERYLERPRHVEVQVFADAHGNGVHLNERDCSVQRRHQKVIEEAPAPGLDEATRREMGEVAVRAALAIDYRGAGTVEFLYDTATGDFHFMEMNTRLQVEHPVTEMITGLDLVEWQLRVAAGAPLPLDQAAIPRRGHAIEVRIYAEDPEGGFLPSTGTITRLRLPAEMPGVRVDTGVREGDAIGIHYDPMIAKLIVHGADRAQAVGRLRQALAESEVAGPRTNVAFLARIAALPAFVGGEVDTGIIERHAATLLPAPAPPPADALALAVLRVLTDRDVLAMAPRGADPWSPWRRLPAWRLNAPGEETIELVTTSGDIFAVRVTHEAGALTLVLPGGDRVAAQARPESDDRLAARLDDRAFHGRVARRGDLLTVTIGAERYPLTVRTLARAAGGHAIQQGHLSAPMPGRVIAVHVAAGESVTRGQPLLVLEAMKMEHAIKAPVAGTVESVAFAVGDLVEEGVELIAIRADEIAAP